MSTWLAFLSLGGENIKTGHVGLMPKLEDFHKEFVKKFGEEPLTEKGIQR